MMELHSSVTQINQIRTMRKCLFSLNELFHILTQAIYTIALLVSRTTYTFLLYFFFFWLLLLFVYWVSVQLFVTPWTAAPQVPLSFNISWCLVKFMSTELVMLSNHLILFSFISPTSSLAFKLSEHQSLLQWVSSLHQVTQVLELQHQSFQWMFRIDFL